ncbi:MAG: amidohydrolase family protein [Bacteroidetes bacterium]|nr:amidohydrolase family protein [Bacteroidota bacterium]
MTLRKFQATEIFDGRTLLPNHVLISDSEGTVIDLIPAEQAGESVEVMKGTLMPGFINAHCHLELSHLKDVIPPHTGLIEFLCSVVTKRGFNPAVIQEKIRLAEQEMYQNGIVGVGDIGNTADTAAVKKQSRIYWQNFTEVLSFTDEKAEASCLHFEGVVHELKKALANSPLPHRTNLVPHAPYSISPKSFEWINQATAGEVISMHNQEHPAEDHLYQTGKSEYLRLFKIFGIEQSPFPVTGKSALRSVLPYFNRNQTILLVHNTSTSEEDIAWAEQYAKENGLTLYWCLCINANRYIENKTPPIEALMKHGCRIVLGTDSYSSNWQLSIAKELQTIHNHFPLIPKETLLQWATSSSANALRWEETLGSFQKGKKPGIVLLSENWETSTRLL